MAFVQCAAARSLARQASAAIWTTVCASAATIDGRDAIAVRTFFERHFSAYQVLAADGEAKGLVTGYYEPLLHGSRQRDDRYRVPLYGPPDDLLTVELGDLYPELKDKRGRARVDGKRVVPYWPRADIDAGKAAVSGGNCCTSTSRRGVLSCRSDLGASCPTPSCGSGTRTRTASRIARSDASWSNVAS
jgi:membrane-bound lytic murein transglycosylase